MFSHGLPIDGQKIKRGLSRVCYGYSIVRSLHKSNKYRLSYSWVAFVSSSKWHYQIHDSFFLWDRINFEYSKKWFNVGVVSLCPDAVTYRKYRVVDNWPVVSSRSGHWCPLLNIRYHWPLPECLKIRNEIFLKHVWRGMTNKSKYTAKYYERSLLVMNITF